LLSLGDFLTRRSGELMWLAQAVPWLGLVARATIGKTGEFSALKFRCYDPLQGNISGIGSRTSLGVNHDHLAPSLVGFHHAMGLTDLLETEDPGGLDVEPTGRGVGGNLLKRYD
jgi:hypothetical protein